MKSDSHQINSLRVETVDQEQAKVFSFDVFDTVFTRITANPAAVFQILQRRLKQSGLSLPEPLLNDFIKHRKAAEADARQGGVECNILQIYQCLGRTFDLDRSVQEKLIEEEVACELDSIRPVPAVIDLLNRLRKKKRKVIFVSDMYLPADVIQRMLERVGAYQPGETIYVSNEHGMTKKEGQLFKHVLKQEQCQPAEMIHIGDNRLADVQAGQALGIRCLYFEETRLNRYERILVNPNQSTETSDIWRETMAGAARLARLHHSGISSAATTLHTMGAGLAGPVLLGYLVWVLQEAQKRGIPRLYFVARDGQILLKVAQVLQPYVGTKIDLRYLYGSRKAFYLPAAQSIGEDELNWLLQRHERLTIDLVAGRGGIKPQVIQSTYQTQFGRSIRSDKSLSVKEINHLRSLLKGQLAEPILSEARRQRETILAYFRQEGLFDGPFGLVDLGWQGTIQDTIAAILTAGGQEQDFLGFYFGVTPSRRTQGVTAAKKLGYYFAQHPVPETCPVSWNAMRILEIFTTADHGLTLAYQNKDGQWLPELKEGHNQEAEDWGLAHLRQGIDDFLNHLPKEFSSNINGPMKDQFKGSISALFKSLVSKPAPEEARILGRYPFKAEPMDCFARGFAPAFRVGSALRYGLNGKSKEVTNWFRASYIRSSFIGKVVIRVVCSSPVQGLLQRGRDRQAVGKKVKKLRIAVVTGQFPCLSETFILNHITDLIEAGHDVDIFAFSQPGQQDEVHEHIAEYDLLNKTRYVFDIPKGRWQRFKKAAAIFARYLFVKPLPLLRWLTIPSKDIYTILNGLFQIEPFLGKRYDCVHCHFGPIGKEMVFIKDFLKEVALVTTFHGFDMSLHIKKWGPQDYAELFHKGDIFLPISEHWQQVLVELGCPADKIKVHHMGVNPDHFKPQKRFSGNGATQILSLGRLVDKKAHRFVLQALAKIIKTKPDVHYTIAGDGPLRRELETLTRELSLQDHVEFLGPVEQSQAQKLYAQADIFTLPSITAANGDKEGIPVVLMEAMAAGLPVVSTYHSGIPELVQNGHSGFLVPERDVDQLADRLTYLIRHPWVRAEMGHRGRRAVETKFNSDQLTQRLEAIYYQAAEERKGRR